MMIIGVYQPIQPIPMAWNLLPMKTKTATNSINSKLSHPVSWWVRLAAARRELFWLAMSRRARLKRLKALAPKRFPTVKSGAPTKVTALTPLKSSGNEVIMARRMSPIQTPPRPVFSAIISPYLATFLPEKKMIRMQKINLIQTKSYLLRSIHFISASWKCQHLLYLREDDYNSKVILIGVRICTFIVSTVDSPFST